MHRWLWVLLTLSPCMAQVSLREEVQVVLRDIRVHVFDKDGQPVRGLTNDDFILTEDGNTQAAQYFEEVDFSRPIEALSEGLSHRGDVRQWVFVIDSANMSPEIFKSAIKAVRDLVEKTDLSQTRVKVVQLESAMEHLTEFTSDRGSIVDGLRTAIHEGRLWKELNRIELDTVSEVNAPGTHSGTIQAVKANLQRKASIKAGYYQSFYLNMRAISTILKPMSGHKSVFLISGGSFLETEGEYLGTDRYAERLGRLFNNADATFYSLLRKPMVPAARRFLNRGVRALPAGMSYRTLSRATVFPPSEAFPIVSRNTVFENQEQMETGPEFAAEMTGGFFRSAQATDFFSTQLPEMVGASQHYYRFRYTRLGEDLGLVSSLKIQLKNRNQDWRLAYGREFENKHDYNSLDADEKSLEREATLRFGRDFRNDFDAAWSFQVFRGRFEGLRIPVFVDVPGGWFENQANLEMTVLIFDDEDRILDRMDAALNNLDGVKPLFLYDVAVVEETPARIKLYLRNLENGNFLLDERRLVDHPEQLKGDHLSGIALSGARRSVVLALNEARDSNEERDLLRQQEDPFVLSGNRFVPRAEQRFSIKEPIFFFMRVRGLQFSDGHFEIKVLLTKNGQSYKANSRLIDNQPITEGTGLVGAFETTNLDPGHYTLSIRLTHPDTGENLSRTRLFRID